MDLISVIIPVYNVEKYITKTIESVLIQTYTNFELILVDDGSQDNSGQICDIYSAKDQRVRVIHKKNGGVSSARNVGIDLSSGKYIAFIDGDDFVSEHYLETLHNMLVTNNVDMAVQVYYNMYPTGKEKSVKEHINEVMSAWQFIEFEILEGRDTSPYVKLYKTEIIKKYNIRFDENVTNLEDMLFLFHYVKECSSVFYNTDEINYYRIIRNDGVVFSKFTVKKLTAMKARHHVFEYLKFNKPNLLMKHITCELNDGINFWVEMLVSHYSDKELLEIKNYTKKRMVYLLKKRQFCMKSFVKIVLLLTVPNVYCFARKYIKKGKIYT